LIPQHDMLCTDPSSDHNHRIEAFFHFQFWLGIILPREVLNLSILNYFLPLIAEIGKEKRLLETIEGINNLLIPVFC